MNVWCLALLLALAAGQDRGDDLELRIRTATTQIEFGVAFELTVVRAWTKTLEPEPWQDRTLAPLTLQLVDTARREDGERVEETLRFRAYAFQVGELAIAAPAFRATARADGSLRATFGDELHLEVRSALPVEPGPVELPRDVFPATDGRRYWLGFGALAVAAALAFAGYVRRTRRRAVVAAGETPHDRALRRLRALRQRTPTGPDEIRADAVEASAVLRDYLLARFDVAAPSSTTDEIAATLPPAHRDALDAVLRDCDLSKFARRLPTADERQRRLDAIEAFVVETAG